MNAIDVTKLRNTVCVQLMKDHYAIVNRNDPAELNIGTKLAALQTEVDEINALFKKNAGQ